MNEPLLPVLQRLQNILVPAILAGTGAVLFIASISGAFWRRELSPGRRKTVGCFGVFFLLISILLYGVPLLLSTYAPALTFGEIFSFLTHSLILLLEGLQNTPIPPILAGSGCIVIIVSIAGIFAGRKITLKKQVLSACIGIFLLICGIFLYEVPFSLPHNSSGETLQVFFREGNKGVTTKLSYRGLTTVTITGEAKKSGIGFADAFYFYGSSASHPVHNTSYTIWINDKPCPMSTI
jgi:hypothetical protein